MKLKDNNEESIESEDRPKCALKRFGLREMKDQSKDLVSKAQYLLMEEFVNSEDIIVRKADKNNIVVARNKTDNMNKITDLISDRDKLNPIPKDPTNAFETDINKLITTINTDCDCNLTKISEHYKPGYIYANLKTRKSTDPSPPLIC